MKNLNLFAAVVTLLWLVLPGCGGERQITFSSSEPGSIITVVPMDNPEGSSAPSPNPFVTTSTNMAGKAVRIAAAGKAAQYWFPPDDSARRIDVKVRQLSACQVQEKNNNRPVRLIMKAYQALSAKDLRLAKELAQKAADVDATLAAPLIITGLAFYQEGRRDQARVAFNKARSLDPEDSEIGELLRMVQ